MPDLPIQPPFDSRIRRADYEIADAESMVKTRQTENIHGREEGAEGGGRERIPIRSGAPSGSPAAAARAPGAAAARAPGVAAGALLLARRRWGARGGEKGRRRTGSLFYSGSCRPTEWGDRRLGRANGLRIRLVGGGGALPCDVLYPREGAICSGNRVVGICKGKFLLQDSEIIGLLRRSKTC